MPLEIFLLFILLTNKYVNASFKARLIACPINYQKINNGCYYFSQYKIATENHGYTWQAANNFCRGLITNQLISGGVITHLVAFESQNETIALTHRLNDINSIVSMFNIYFPVGNRSMNANNYWMDLVGTSMKTWSWSNHNYANYRYIKDNFSGNSFGYLKHNSSNQYEINDDNGLTKMGFICEAQIPCLNADNVCENNGTCYVNSGNVLCLCSRGFYGEYCENFGLSNSHDLNLNKFYLWIVFPLTYLNTKII